MSTWKQKRFWEQVSVTESEGRFAIELDGRQVKTPAKAVLSLPTRAMAEAIAEEWRAQDGAVNPHTMPCTRSANAALDKVQIQHIEVADMLAEYGDSDLLCYRAESPIELVQRQNERWNPALDWAATELGVRLILRQGIQHQPQDAKALQSLRTRVQALSAFQLAAFHDLVSMSGSLILGFAAAADWRGAAEIWALSRLDELWQEEQWGPDDEAQADTEIKRLAFLHAKRFYDFC
ncbi:ATPase [Rhodobacterales bacterium 56_14_T64]|nr:ATPase [Rhodobacterales bacterium 56_14_T64]